VKRPNWLKQRVKQQLLRPCIVQVAEDTVENRLIGIYYGAFSDVYDDRMVPVSWEQEITLVFENEQLRKHGLLNTLYYYIRLLLYGRKTDIETFYLYGNQHDIAHLASFPNIYSGTYTFQYDTIHQDKTPPHPLYEIQSWLQIPDNEQRLQHPIIYVNTSNHALATHDNNSEMAKQIFIPYNNIKTGYKTRAQLEKKHRLH
jgi:hypothetical protein